jgi:hypothetical protein
MMTYRVGVVGGLAAAAAMAAHLNQKTLPDAQLALSEYYRGGPALRTQAEAALASGMNVLPFAREDLHPELAKALSIQAGGLVQIEALAHILRGRAANGGELAGHKRDVRRYRPKAKLECDAVEEDGKTRNRVAYMDFTFSVPKAVSVAWMAAATEAERNAILQACRSANEKFLRYVEDQIGVAGFGKSRGKGSERGAFAWITCTHFTSRPTLAITRPDPTTGVVDTELVDVLPHGMMPGDPQIHFHNVIPNLMATESGRLVSINRDLLKGRVHEFGAVGQAFLAAELEALGIHTARDERTQLLTLPCIPQHVCDEFSKRTKGAEEAARAMAREEGLDWDELDADRKVLLLKGRAQATRQGKGDDLASAEAWRAQMQALGWEHRTAIAYGPANPYWTRDARLEHAYQAALVAFAPELERRAVVEGFDARLASARGHIASGGISDSADIGTVTRAMVKRGVVQEGQETKLVWRHFGRGVVKLTTELHRDGEEEVIRLARAAASNTDRALSPGEIGAAVKATGFDYSGKKGQAQRKIVDEIGPQGELAVFIGSAGVGKTSRILPPLVRARQAQGRDGWGLAQAWRQARALHEAGIKRENCRALQPFLDGVAAGRIKLTSRSYLVVDELSQIGTRQLLLLLRLQRQHGFSLLLTGDDRQCQSIKAGPVIELLRRALGAEAIPEILNTVRQRTERGQEIAGLFRRGDETSTTAAIDALRADGEAQLVPGGYRECVDRVADLYMARVQANAHDPAYTVTITAPTNADALAIGREVRERLKAAGLVTGAETTLPVSDKAGNLASIAVAAGDRVRLYQTTRGLFMTESGRRKSAHIGDNGSVLKVVEVMPHARTGGLLLETEAGKIGFVSWDALRDKATGRTLLGLGYCLTVDSAQGLTSDEHISAMPSGSSAVQAFKAYVQASRHRVTHWMVGSMGAEMREVAARRPENLKEPVTEAECWRNVARNLSRADLKELATDMLAAVRHEAEQGAKALQAVLLAQEARAAAGVAVSTLSRALSLTRAREALSAVMERLEAAMRERVPLLGRAEAAAHEAARAREAHEAAQAEHGEEIEV